MIFCHTCPNDSFRRGLHRLTQIALLSNLCLSKYKSNSRVNSNNAKSLKIEEITQIVTFLSVLICVLSLSKDLWQNKSLPN